MSPAAALRHAVAAAGPGSLRALSRSVTVITAQVSPGDWQLGKNLSHSGSVAAAAAGPTSSPPSHSGRVAAAPGPGEPLGDSDRPATSWVGTPRHTAKAREGLGGAAGPRCRRRSGSIWARHRPRAGRSGREINLIETSQRIFRAGAADVMPANAGSGGGARLVGAVRRRAARSSVRQATIPRAWTPKTATKTTSRPHDFGGGLLRGNVGRRARRPVSSRRGRRIDLREFHSLR